MYKDEYFKVSELDLAGNTSEALALLIRLADEGNALALLNLSTRYYSIDGFAFPVEPLEPDHMKSEELAIKAKQKLEEHSKEGDGEAMRMLASTYFGHWHPVHEKSTVKAESLLLKAIEAKCHFAANELATFYQDSDIEKAKYYYQMAEKYNCRVVYNEDLEI